MDYPQIRQMDITNYQQLHVFLHSELVDVNINYTDKIIKLVIVNKDKGLLVPQPYDENPLKEIKNED